MASKILLAHKGHVLCGCLRTVALANFSVSFSTTVSLVQAIYWPLQHNYIQHRYLQTLCCMEQYMGKYTRGKEDKGAVGEWEDCAQSEPAQVTRSRSGSGRWSPLTSTRSVSSKADFPLKFKSSERLPSVWFHSQQKRRENSDNWNHLSTNNYLKIKTIKWINLQVAVIRWGGTTERPDRDSATQPN